MAYENTRDTIEGLEAGADLSAAQFHVVKLDASGNVVLSSVATDTHLGILQNKPVVGEAATVSKGGVSKGLIGSVSVGVGDYLTSDAVGRLATAALDQTPGEHAVGIALEDGNPGQIISVDLDRMKA